MRPRTVTLVAFVAATFSCSPAAPAPAPAAVEPAPLARRVGTMSELMVDFIYPASDAVFYISSRTPTTSEDWMALQGQTLMLAEAANLLMMPGRARDQDRWMVDAALMLDAGEAAYRAAKDRDLPALEGLSDQLYESCVTCHRDYRPNYGR
jgi:hypothetical protein